MAFNPFHKFRKHQKVMFAIMTIVAMFSFVLLSGVGTGGDMISALGHWFGRGSTGPAVADLYGKKVTLVDLRELSQQRQIANFFMSAATSAARDKRMEELRPSGNQPMTQDFLQRMFSDPEILQLQQRANMQPYFGGSEDECAEWLAGYVRAGARHIVLRLGSLDAHSKHLHATAEAVLPLLRSMTARSDKHLPQPPQQHGGKSRMDRPAEVD